MNDQSKSAVALLASGVTAAAGAMSAMEIVQIIYIILGIAGALITLGLNAWRVWDKIREAAKDGHITQDEKDDIKKDIEESTKEFTDSLEDIDRKGEGKE